MAADCRLQNLYFYSLACSPMENEEQSRWRKGKLRYHQPPPQPPTTYYSFRPSIPVDVQSASTSPHDVHFNLPPALPRFHETDWSQQHPQYASKVPPFTAYSTPPQELPHCMKYSVPSAPFANAGPPGVQFYHNPVPVQHASAGYPYDHYTRGRRFQ